MNDQQMRYEALLRMRLPGYSENNLKRVDVMNRQVITVDGDCRETGRIYSSYIRVKVSFGRRKHR